jgi:WD40 repeat protein
VSPDGKLLVCGQSGGVRFWEAGTETCRSTLEGHRGGVTGVALWAPGNLMASKSLDGSVRLWRSVDGAWQSGELVGVLEEPSVDSMVAQGLYCGAGIAFHPREPVLATLGDEDTSVRVWLVEPASLGLLHH